jgi:hypothetical protein
MKPKVLSALGLIVMIWAMFSSVPAWAQTNRFPLTLYNPGPYYEYPSWDQTLPSNLRFIVLSNMNKEAVLDKETGLVWEQSPSTSKKLWMEAHYSCNMLMKGGRFGWRLPTLQELASLLDPTKSNPALPAFHPFNNVQFSSPFYYWTATTSNITLNESTFIWIVSFASPVLGLADISDQEYFVWCVRGGQGVNPQ